jgi:hypothetical protein
MTKKLTLSLLVAIGLVWVPMAVAQDTPESIEKAVIESWDKLSSLSANLNLNSDFPMNLIAALISNKPPDPNNTAKGKLAITGNVNYVKKDPTPCSRLELHAALNETLKARILSNCDGTDAYRESEFFGKVESKKIEPKDVPALGGKALFDRLKGNFDLAAQPSEKVGDKDAYVLDATPKTPDPNGPIYKLRFWFAKDSGVMLKGEAFDGANASLATLMVTDTKLNQPIAPEQFKYTPPTPPTPPPAPAPAPAPAAPASPAPAK